MAAACCDGLQYAHDLTDVHGTPLGLVHRDLSLNNVMIADTGNVTLLDFGIATASVRGIGTREGDRARQLGGLGTPTRVVIEDDRHTTLTASHVPGASLVAVTVRRDAVTPADSGTRPAAARR